jgi:hypothetical protein
LTWFGGSMMSMVFLSDITMHSIVALIPLVSITSILGDSFS